MKKLVYIVLLLIICLLSNAQEKKDISAMTKEDVLELTYDELLEMPFEDVMKLADIIGVSMEELYEMLLNKDVVSASKKVESSFEAPLPTSVISYDEILKSGARSIEEALRLVPGLIVREKTNGNFDIHIRGNDNTPPKQMLLYAENSITLVMIDGRPVYNYVHGGTFWETLPIGIDDVDRIEVVRGPSSALYGPNAVSGVVNIITKKTIDKKLGLNANAQTGNLGTFITSLGGGYMINKKMSLRVTGNFETLDRNTSDLYVHRAYDRQGGFISLQELDTLHDGDYYVFDPSDNIYDMYPKPDRARFKYGFNGYLTYNVNKDNYMNVKGGYQYSDILSTTMGDNPASHAGRQSNTYYFDYQAKTKGIRAQFNCLGGWQDIVKQDTGFKVNILNINANIEYDINIGNFNIRPGYSYQLAKYNDLDFLRYEGQGFLNGTREFNSNALSLRADYRIVDNLRIIGALRGEKYNTHDNPYLTYQLIGVYDINEKNNIRLVYSKANRSPFLIDTYADFMWERVGRPEPGYIYFRGQKNLDLLKMNMVEIGYRIKPANNIMVDLEGFYSIAKDFGALYPDSVNLNGAQNGTGRTWARMTYSNLDLKSKQLGATATFSWVAKENLLLKFFCTYQQTRLENAIVFTQDETLMYMLGSAATNGLGYSTDFPSDKENINNLATPVFYGGAIANYSTHNQKLNINLNSYFYTEQKFNSKYTKKDLETGEYIPDIVSSKIIMNAKVSYNIVKPLDVFINARNILGEKKEFSYMDNIGTLILIGASLNL
jgi:iron complex outermembrane recepter protein